MAYLIFASACFLGAQQPAESGWYELRGQVLHRWYLDERGLPQVQALDSLKGSSCLLYQYLPLRQAWVGLDSLGNYLMQPVDWPGEWQKVGRLPDSLLSLQPELWQAIRTEGDSLYLYHRRHRRFWLWQPWSGDLHLVLDSLNHEIVHPWVYHPADRHFYSLDVHRRLMRWQPGQPKASILRRPNYLSQRGLEPLRLWPAAQAWAFWLCTGSESDWYYLDLHSQEVIALGRDEPKGSKLGAYQGHFNLGRGLALPIPPLLSWRILPSFQAGWWQLQAEIYAFWPGILRLQTSEDARLWQTLEERPLIEPGQSAGAFPFRYLDRRPWLPESSPPRYYRLQLVQEQEGRQHYSRIIGLVEAQFCFASIEAGRLYVQGPVKDLALFPLNRQAKQALWQYQSQGFESGLQIHELPVLPSGLYALRLNGLFWQILSCP